MKATHDYTVISAANWAICSLGVEAVGTLPHRHYRLSCQFDCQLFEGNRVSFDFNWLRLNEVIFRYCVTCLECLFCNSCMRCVGDCSLGPKLTTYSLHMAGAGWYAVRDGHGPTGRGMKGLGGWC